MESSAFSPLCCRAEVKLAEKERTICWPGAGKGIFSDAKILRRPKILTSPHPQNQLPSSTPFKEFTTFCPTGLRAVLTLLFTTESSPFIVYFFDSAANMASALAIGLGIAATAFFVRLCSSAIHAPVEHLAHLVPIRGCSAVCKCVACD